MATTTNIECANCPDGVLSFTHLLRYQRGSCALAFWCGRCQTPMTMRFYNSPATGIALIETIPEDDEDY